MSSVSSRRSREAPMDFEYSDRPTTPSWIRDTASASKDDEETDQKRKDTPMDFEYTQHPIFGQTTTLSRNPFVSDEKATSTPRRERETPLDFAWVNRDRAKPLWATDKPFAKREATPTFGRNANVPLLFDPPPPGIPPYPWLPPQSMDDGALMRKDQPLDPTSSEGDPAEESQHRGSRLIRLRYKKDARRKRSPTPSRDWQEENVDEPLDKRRRATVQRRYSRSLPVSVYQEGNSTLLRGTYIIITTTIPGIAQ
ncbi:hypothetical protein BKA70DRAFT_1219171 [Coprinopsis sp. MPI-PUGE-AT-0042]|nr:hypothetical protein BKA70DRAFT_1219171 [Coprinopsis sp. MPI-PUGE-AT-0042]